MIEKLLQSNTQRLDTLESSPLAKLPVEVLQQIADSLPVVSATTLSLSCRKILHLIGTKYLKELATFRSRKLEILNLLERDLRDQIVCIPCKRLHKIQDARKYTINGHQDWAMSPCILADGGGPAIFIHESFSTTIFKMLMKHHHYFGDETQSRQLISLLSEDCQNSDKFSAGRDLKADFRIKNGSLYMLKRVVFHGKYRDVIQELLIPESICPHLEGKSTGPASLCGATLDPPRDKWFMPLPCNVIPKSNGNSVVICSKLLRCQYCRTEYKTSLEHKDGCRSKLTVTIWKDLGHGIDSKEWKAHIDNNLSSPLSIQWQAGEIAAVFDEVIGPR